MEKNPPGHKDYRLGGGSRIGVHEEQQESPVRPEKNDGGGGGGVVLGEAAERWVM